MLIMILRKWGEWAPGGGSGRKENNGVPSFRWRRTFSASLGDPPLQRRSSICTPPLIFHAEFRASEEIRWMNTKSTQDERMRKYWLLKEGEIDATLVAGGRWPRITWSLKKFEVPSRNTYSISFSFLVPFFFLKKKNENSIFADFWFEIFRFWKWLFWNEY